MLARRKERAVDFLNLVVARRIAEAYRLHTAPDGRHHNVHYAAGLPALQRGMEEVHERFPSARVEIHRVVGEGDLAVVHSHVTMEPGDPGFAAVHLFRFDENEKIAELWDCVQAIPADSPNRDGAF